MPIEYVVNGRIATITIDGYNDLNPITTDMYRDLFACLVELDASPDVHVGVLRGAGEHHFSAGGDLKRAAYRPPAERTRAARLHAFWYPHSEGPGLQGVRRITTYDRRLLTPVVAAIRGWCLGAALIQIGMNSSIRVAGQSAKFGFAEVRIGLGGGAGMWSRLGQQIPRSALMWLVSTGRNIDAEHAFRIGLVNEVVPDDHVVARAYEIAQIIAERPRVAVRAEREALLRSEAMTTAQTYALSRSLAQLASLAMEPTRSEPPPA